MRVCFIPLLAVLAFANLARADEPYTVLRDHKGLGSVYAAALSADGKQAATAEWRFGTAQRDDQHAVILWDVATRRLKTTLTHDGLVQSVAFSPDGKLVASGSADFTKKKDGQSPGVIGLWDATSGKRVHQFEGHDTAVVSVRFSGDGALLASADLFGTVKLWDVAARKELKTLLSEGERLLFGWDMAFAPDGKTLATAGGKVDGVRLWDVAAGKVASELTEKLAVNAVAYSPDGKWLAYNNHSIGAGKGMFIKVMDLAGKARPRLLNGLDVNCLAFSADGKKLAAGRKRPFSDVVVWDLATEKAWHWPGAFAQGATIHSVGFAADGTTVLVASDNGKVLLWDLRAAKGPVDRPF